MYNSNIVKKQSNSVICNVVATMTSAARDIEGLHRYKWYCKISDSWQIYIISFIYYLLLLSNPNMGY